MTEVLFEDEAAGGGGGRVCGDINTKNAVGGKKSIHGSSNSRRPVAVMVEQKHPTEASKGTFGIRQKVRVLLAKAKAWDKQRESIASEEQKEEARRVAAVTKVKPFAVPSEANLRFCQKRRNPL